MMPLSRPVRQRRTFQVVRIRRIKRRTPTPIGPRREPEPAQQPDLSALILYGQA
jgi:hypothetical protein